MNNCNHTFLIDSKTCKYCKITEKEFYVEQVAPFYQFNRIIEIKRELRTRFCPEKLIEQWTPEEKYKEAINIIQNYPNLSADIKLFWERRKILNHPLWKDFLNFSSLNNISIENEENWKPWWDCFLAGAQSQEKK